MSNAEKAVFIHDVSEYKSELSIYFMQEILSENTYDAKKLYANKGTMTYEGNIIKDKNMKDVITIMKESHLDKFEISDGELRYIGDSKEEEDTISDIIPQANLIIDMNVKDINYIDVLLNIKLSGKYVNNDDIGTVTLKYKKLDEEYKDAQLIYYNKDQTEYTLNGLSMGTIYDIMLTVKIKSNDNTYTYELKDIETKIVKTRPTAPTNIEKNEKINSVEVKASGSTDEAYVAGYKYSLDNTNWSELVGVDEYYVFENIKSNTGIDIYAKAVNGANLESDVYSTSGTTIKPIENVKLAISNTNLTNQSVNVSLSYPIDIPKDYLFQYKIGTGNWEYGDIATVDNNTTVYARLYNSILDDEISNNSIDITNIDKTNPVITNFTYTVNKNSISITGVTASDNIKVAKYEHSIPNVFSNYPGILSQTVTISSLSPNTTYAVTVKVYDEAGNYSALTKNIKTQVQPITLANQSFGISGRNTGWQTKAYITVPNLHDYTTLTVNVNRTYYWCENGDDGNSSLSIGGTTIWGGYSQTIKIPVSSISGNTIYFNAVVTSVAVTTSTNWTCSGIVLE